MIEPLRREAEDGAHLAGVERIAVLRANGIGDLMFAVPALEALDAAYPDAEIVLLGAPWHGELLGNRPGPVDRVEVVPEVPGVRLTSAGPDPAPVVDDFFERMAALRFDLALQLHGGGANSNPFVKRLGARVTAGLRAEDAPALDRWIRYVYYQPEVLRYLEVVALVGAPPCSVEPTLAVLPEDREEARAVLGEGRRLLGAPGPGRRPLVVLNAGATDTRRRWPPERFAGVGDALAVAGAEIVVAGSGEDVGLAEAVLATMAQPARSLAGRLSLGGLVGLVAESDLVISNDTGPLHLAAAVGTPTVGIYWLGNALNGGPPVVHTHRKAISWTVRCPECGVDCVRDSCEHRCSFVADVAVAEVLEPALDLLAAVG